MTRTSRERKPGIARLFIENLGLIFDRHIAALAIHTSTDVVLALVAGDSNHFRHSALDDNLAALTILTAADTCSLVTTDSLDLTAVNRDVATR